MFGELAVNVATDGIHALVGVDDQRVCRRNCRAGIVCPGRLHGGSQEKGNDSKNEWFHVAVHFKKRLGGLQAFFRPRPGRGLKIRVHSPPFLFKYRAPT
jgi:hypothetical protein